MPWFKVDDKLHDHRKTRRVRRSHPSKRRDVAPFGLWVLAGSWAADNGTEGFVPVEVLEEFDEDALNLAERLVNAGLWWETKEEGEEGFGFHDWHDYVARPDGIEDASESGKRGNHIRWHEKRGQNDPECEFCNPDSSPRIAPDIAPINRPESGGESGNRSRSRPDPTRPDPKTRPSKLDQGDIEAAFSAWYLRYPKKVGRGNALRAYRAACKKVDADTLLDALERQLPGLLAREQQYRPNPSSWLNGERWSDEVLSTQPDLPHVDDIPEPPDGLTDEQWREWYDQQVRSR